MAIYNFTELTDRALLRVDGADASNFLQGLVTCEVETLKTGEAAFGALLSPQGKILFDFFLTAAAEGYILDVASSMADAFVKRLTFYKLRAKVAIEPMEEHIRVFAIFGEIVSPRDVLADGVVTIDPRNIAMGARAYLRQAPPTLAPTTREEWDRRRILLGMPEGGKDFTFGDAFPHEALMDQFKGVDFSKGCYVGQEVVSRMQHRGTARKRIIKISSEQMLPESGSQIHVGDKAVGEVCSKSGRNGLAILRLDRAAGHVQGEPAFAGTTPVTLSIPDWCSFGWPDHA